MKPTMNMACVNKCVKGGKTRSACMSECYPEKGGKSKKKSSSSKKPSPFEKKGTRY
jgi:hypothetical protein